MQGKAHIQTITHIQRITSSHTYQRQQQNIQQLEWEQEKVQSSDIFSRQTPYIPFGLLYTISLYKKSEEDF